MHTIGLREERAGDELLVANAEKFWWFGHTYHHVQPHLVSPENLRRMMEKNLEFARVIVIPDFLHVISVLSYYLCLSTESQYPSIH